MIKVLDKNLTFKNALSNFTSFNCERLLNGIGTFTLLVNKNKLKVAFAKNDILYIRKSAPYIVKQIEISKSTSKRDEMVKVTGYELKSLINQRITIPAAGSIYDSYSSKSVEYIVKKLIDKSIINATDTNRNISDVVLATDLDRGSVIDFNTRYTNVFIEIQQLLLNDNMGFSAVLNESDEIEYDVFMFTDKTYDQAVNNRIIFSLEKYNNLKSIEIVFADGKNSCYTGGEGDGTTRIISESGTESGIARQEIFFDANDISDTTELQEESDQRLIEVQEHTTINGVVEQNNYTYLTDYDIGDLITFQDSDLEDGNIDMLITGAIEVYEGNKPVVVDLVFNYGIKTLADIFNITKKNNNSTITK